MTIFTASYALIYSVLLTLSTLSCKLLAVSIILILTNWLAHNITEVATCLKNLVLYAISHFIPGHLDFKKLPYGKWCIVTGATQGIGKAYAEAFAKRGMNLLIISRSEDKLKAFSQELTKKYKIDATYLAMDFSKSPSTYVSRLRICLNEKRTDGTTIAESIGVLVNNVGALPYAYDTLVNDIARRQKENPLENYGDRMQKNLNTNCLSQMVMTSEIITLMRNKPIPVGNTSGKKGIIISLSSYTCKRPMPFWVAYTACKAFNFYFSDALATEISFTTNDLIVQTVAPMEVATSMAPREKSGWRAPSADQFVEVCINLIGWSKYTHGWPIHDLRALFNDCVGGGHFAIYIVLFDRYKRITAGRLRKQQIMLREMREKVVKNTKSALSRVSSMEGVKRTVTRVASSDMVKRVVTRVASRDTRDHTE